MPKFFIILQTIPPIPKPKVASLPCNGELTRRQPGAAQCHKRVPVLTLMMPSMRCSLDLSSTLRNFGPIHSPLFRFSNPSHHKFSSNAMLSFLYVHPTSLAFVEARTISPFSF